MASAEMYEIDSANAFCQFSFDNADHNTCTIDGRNTFHAMGGIECVTPGSAVLSAGRIPKLATIPSASSMSIDIALPLLTFDREAESGLKNIIVSDPKYSSILCEDHSAATLYDFLWLCSHILQNLDDIPNWQQFFEMATRNFEFQQSRILFLPFINHPPSNYDTVYTALTTAVREMKKFNQKICFVTFDQPLYIKARDIISRPQVHAEFANVVTRLGGFHLFMSFLGAVGYIMEGSGLEDLFTVIFAANSVTKIMCGHAYARCVRAHFLVHVALTSLIFAEIEWSEIEKNFISEAFTSIVNNDNGRHHTIPEWRSPLQEMSRKFENQLTLIEKRGPTAKLWIEYYRLISLMKKYVQAERMGNWSLHLQCVYNMLPFFHASGHFNYAKSAHLYLQDMINLESRMEPDEFRKMCSEGYFTIRRSSKFWCGTWSDMVIEQTLMRLMKSSGGLTRGRGITPSVLIKWTKNMAPASEICQSLEVFSGMKDNNEYILKSAIKRDKKDIEKLTYWLKNHFPFDENPDLMSLSTGVIGDTTINCYNAREIGMKNFQSILNLNFSELSFKRGTCF